MGTLPQLRDERDVAAAVGRFRDCVACREAIECEETLQLLRREYETVFENVKDALFLLDVDVDDDGTIRYQRFNERES